MQASIYQGDCADLDRFPPQSHHFASDDNHDLYHGPIIFSQSASQDGRGARPGVEAKRPQATVVRLAPEQAASGGQLPWLGTTSADRLTSRLFRSTIARSFSSELMDIFRIENSVADLDEKVSER